LLTGGLAHSLGLVGGAFSHPASGVDRLVGAPMLLVASLMGRPIGRVLGFFLPNCHVNSLSLQCTIVGTPG
jgi:hypothetical protein